MATSDKRFFIPTEELAKAIGAVYRAASTDETRPHMNAVHVAREGAALHFVATNCHWMAVYTTSLPFVDAEWDATISLESATSLMKRAAKKLGQAEIDLDGKKGSARFVDDEVIPLSLVDVQYPPWRQVFPKESDKEAQAEIGVNFGYMASIFASFQAILGKPKRHSRNWEGLLCIEPATKLGPMRVTCSAAPMLEVVIMPGKQPPTAWTFGRTEEAKVKSA